MSKLFTVLTFLLIASNSKAETKEQILKKLNFKPGHYEVIVPADNATAFCQNEELDISLVEDKSELTLAFGDQTVLARLEINQFSEPTTPKCVTTYKNQILENKIEQTRIEKCGKKTSTKKYEALFSKDNIEITVTEQKLKKTCSYKLKEQKG